MSVYLLFLTYTSLALLGAVFHYYKKLYVDNTLTMSLSSYIKTNKAATFKALSAIVTIGYGLTIQDTGDLLSFSEVCLALTSGYTADSSLNRV